MLAVVKTRPEPGLEVLDRPEPQLQRPDEVLVEVECCGVCGTDLHIYAWRDRSLGVTLPRILGHELAGTVVEVGEAVESFAPGDRVVAETWGGCGRCVTCRRGLFNLCANQRRLGQQVDGAMARYVLVPELSLYRIPDRLEFELASLIEPTGVALHALELVTLAPGDSVAVIGPGPIGVLAAILARAAGAEPVFVLGLERDRRRMEIVERLDLRPIYSDDPGAAVAAVHAAHGDGVGVVVDTSGGGTLDLSVELVRGGGEVAMVGLGDPAPFDYSRAVVKEVAMRGVWRRQPETWRRAINLVGSGRVDVGPLITHRGSVAEAQDLFQALLARHGIKAIVRPE